MTLYDPVQPDVRPVSLEEHRAETQAKMSAYDRAKMWLAIKITNALGTMECAFIFICLAIYGFPQNPTVAQLVQWISQTLIQLTALSVLGNGQRIIGDAQDHIIREISKHIDLLLTTDKEQTAHMHAQDRELINQSHIMDLQYQNDAKQTHMIIALQEENRHMREQLARIEHHLILLSDPIDIPQRETLRDKIAAFFVR